MAELSDWPAHVPTHLLARAYKAGGEFAWAQDDAIEVAEALGKQRFPVIGVEIWLPTHPGPTIPAPTFYVWSLQSVGNTPGYPASAVDFIRNFKWAEDDLSHQDLKPYFNLTVMSPDT